MLAQAWIEVKQNPYQVLKKRSRSNNQLGYKLKQSKTYPEYSTKDSGLVACLGINQNQARFNSSILIKIEIRQLIRA